jgi:hypothetical protein
MSGDGLQQGASADAGSAVVPGARPLGEDSQLERFLKLAVAQAGDPYDSAHGEPDTNDPNPSTLDCSELVQWAAHMSGAEITDGSWLQYFQLQDRGGAMSVEDAMNTPGALLFSFDPPPTRGGGRPHHAHVAISLGDGRTIEAMGTKQGIKIASKDSGRWTGAGMIPEFQGQHVDMDEVLAWTGRDDDVASELLDVPIDPNATGDDEPPLPDDDLTAGDDVGKGVAQAGSPPHPVDDPSAPDAHQQSAVDDAATNAGGADTDHDLLPDHFEMKYGLDPNSTDTDGDGITDGYELIVLGTNPDDADTDFDGLSDGLELSLGLDPNAADNPDADADDWAVPDDLDVDSDGDGITDWGERLAHTNAHDVDTDDDGVSDGDEFAAGTDPLKASP